MQETSSWPWLRYYLFLRFYCRVVERHVSKLEFLNLKLFSLTFEIGSPSWLHLLKTEVIKRESIVSFRPPPFPQIGGEKMYHTVSGPNRNRIGALGLRCWHPALRSWQCPLNNCRGNLANSSFRDDEFEDRPRPSPEVQSACSICEARWQQQFYGRVKRV